MKIKVLTLFPELFDKFKELGLMSRAVNKSIIDLELIQLRDFAVNTHGQVDDSPYGGGSGMVLMPEAAVKAIVSAKKDLTKAKVISFSPRGTIYKQADARRLATELQNGQDLIFLCNLYR